MYIIKMYSPMHFRRKKSCKYVLSLLCILASASVFIYTVSQYIFLYVKHSIITQSTISDLTELRPPPLITVCPTGPFNPERLLQFGLDVNVTSMVDIPANIDSLVGVNSSLEIDTLYAKASWQLGEVLEFFEVGNLSVNIELNSTYSQYWQECLTYIGVCYSLNLPTDIGFYNNKMTLRYETRKKSLKKCDEKEILNLGNPCNYSLGWRDYKEYMGTVYVNSLLNGEFVNRKNDPKLTWDVAKVYMNMHSDLLNNHVYTLRYEEKHRLSSKYCNKAKSHNIKCFQLCLNERIQNKHNCDIEAKTLNNSCYELRPYLLLILNDERGICSDICTKCKIRFWKYNQISVNYDILIMHIILTSQKDIEREVYPFSQFLADIGGSLGLFMGISILNMCSFLIGILSRLLKKETAKRLFMFIFIIFLSGTSFVHGLVLLKEYIHQPTMTSVTYYKSNKGFDIVPPNINYYSNVINTDIAIFLSAQALNCVPIGFEISCTMKCLLQNTDHVFGALLPYEKIKLMPKCHKSEMISGIEYFVPSVLQSQLISKKSKCQKICKSTKKIKPSTYPLVNSIATQTSIFSFLNGIGGVVGLYVGYSLISILAFISQHFSKSMKYDNALVEKIVKSLNIIFKIVIFIICVFFISVEVSRFIDKHPFTSTINTRQISLLEQPMITFCKWPPSHGYNFSSTGFGFLVVATCKDASDGNHYQHTTLVKNCNKIIPVCLFSRITISLTSEITEANLPLFSIHRADEPPFVSNAIALNNNHTYTTVNYAEHIGTDEYAKGTFDNCFEKCIHKQLKYYDMCKRFTSDIDTVYCTDIINNDFGTYPFYISAYGMDTNILKNTYFEENGFNNPANISKVSKWFEDYEENTQKCYEFCTKSKLHNFYTISKKAKESYKPRLEIIFDVESYFSLELEDWLSLSQLASNLGGIISCTLGISLYSILLYLIELVLYIVHYKNNQNII